MRTIPSFREHMVATLRVLAIIAAVVIFCITTIGCESKSGRIVKDDRIPLTSEVQYDHTYIVTILEYGIQDTVVCDYISTDPGVVYFYGGSGIISSSYVAVYSYDHNPIIIRRIR